MELRLQKREFSHSILILLALYACASAGTSSKVELHGQEEIFFMQFFHCISEGLETTLSTCCTIGARWSWGNNTCSEHPSPVKGVAPEHQGMCLATIDACCRKNDRERQCLSGQLAAKSGQECRLGSGSGAQYYKVSILEVSYDYSYDMTIMRSHQDCCEGCKLGLVAAAMGLHCEFQSLKLSLGPPWDTSLTKCCLQAGGRSGALPSSSSPYSSSTVSPSGTTAFSLIGNSHVLQVPFFIGSSYYTYRPHSSTPREADQDICALFPGQLCSHNCISEGKSYKCTCREGFRLLPDGKSCQHDSTTSHPSFRFGSVLNYDGILINNS